MKITVVTVTKDNPGELRATLQSLAGARGIESLVINGGSEPVSCACVNEPDEGIADAFNKGVARAAGEGIMFLNSGDTLIDRDYFTAALEVFRRNPDAAFVCSDILVDGRVRVNANPKRSPVRGMPFPHPALIVRKSVFAKVGCFDTSFGIAMDFDFVTRMIRQGFRGEALPGPVVSMEGGGISRTRHRQNLWEFLRVLWRHHPRGQALAHSLLVCARFAARRIVSLK